jgi:hypothetical protein
MADVEIAPTPIADAQAAERFVDDVSAVASRASALAHEVVTGPSFSTDAGLLPIEVEVSGVTGSVMVAAHARPGAVRGAVEKALRDFGLAREADLAASRR